MYSVETVQQALFIEREVGNVHEMKMTGKVKQIKTNCTISGYENIINV